MNNSQEERLEQDTLSSETETVLPTDPENSTETKETKEEFNKRIAATLSMQNPKRAKEIAKERLAQMSSEEISALRAAKKAKIDAQIAAEEAAAAEIERQKQEEIAKKQLSSEQKAMIVEQLSKLTPEQLEAVKANRAAKMERDRRLNEIAEKKAEKKAKHSGEKNSNAAPIKTDKGKKEKKQHNISYESRQAFTGFMFILPWFIGFLLFFAVPALQSLRFSFSKVAALDNYACTWRGLGNYEEMLTSGASFLKALSKSLTDLLVNVPVILIFSLFVAVLLNRKFVGRGLVRGIFFLPVIVTTGVVMTTFNAHSDASKVLEGDVAGGVLFSITDASSFLGDLGLNDKITEYMTMVADRIFNVIWDSGIQILLFLAALQSISPSLYEASDVEGATAWETFWLITFPNVAPIILVNIVYTIVDTFSDTDNAVLQYVGSLINPTFNFGGAAAASWTFFMIILLIIGIIFLIFKLINKNSD